MSQETRPDHDREMSHPDGPVSYTMLDQTLWARFHASSDAEQFLQTWLAIQCRQIGHNVHGALVIGEVPDIGPYHTVGTWPTHVPAKAEMVAAADKARATRSGVVQGEGKQTRYIAHPLIVFEQLFGVVVVSLSQSDLSTSDVFRQLQWGAGWIDAVLRREQETKDGELRERVSVAFDMLATVLEQPKFDAACNALVTDLARRLDCERVSLGFVRRKRHRIASVSHSSGFSKRSNLMRDIASAMDEAGDQRVVISWPEPPDWEFRVTRAHADLSSQYGHGAVLTVPLQNTGDIVGALVFERPRGTRFDNADIEVCDAVASVIGPVLMDRKANARLLPTKIFDSGVGLLKGLVGPAYFGSKLATLVLAAVVAFFWFATTDYRVSSPARITGTIQRTIVAPFNGYLAAQYASAGDLVEDGAVLAALDDKDLSLEQLRLVTARQQRVSELDRALADRELAQVNIIRSQIAQADAQLGLVQEQLSRTRITAPFDGYVVEGDLRQQIGASIERGQTLFQIAPLGSFRVILEIDERDLRDIMVGQLGALRVSAMPQTSLEYRVSTITPLTQQSEGRNWFRVEADLLTKSTEVRPGMEGIARTDVEERLLISTLTDRLVNWARLFVWSWSP
jgi:multidrug efflux pump subunit AcrA (membrane-fusion protein)